MIFILNGLAIVPLNLIKKELQFKRIGIIEMAGSLVSCGAMIAIAKLGGGTWTLLFGHIIRSFAKLVLAAYFGKWVPNIYFKYGDLSKYLNFGVVLSAGRTLRYVFDKSDRFFAAMAWSPNALGLVRSMR